MTRRLPRPWRTSLLWRLVGSFLVLSAMTVVIVGVAVYLRATADLTSSVYERLDSVAEVKADSLDRWVDEQRRNVVFVGLVPGFGDAARAFLDPSSAPAALDAAESELRQVLGTVVRQTADAQEIYLLDLEGMIRLSTRPEHEGITQADELLYSRGLSHTTVQNAYISTLTDLPTITVSTPLFDQDGLGRRVGVIAANLDLERVDRIVLERTGLGDTGATYLVGRGARLLHAVLDQEVGGKAIVSAAVAGALAEQSGQAMYLDYRGVPVIGAYRWLPQHEAGLIAEIGQDEAFAPARDLALTIALVGLASAGLLAIAIWLVARQITRPILALSDVAARVAGGDLRASAQITSEDEVGALAVVFNEMTTQLRESVETLERRVDERTTELAKQKSYFESLVEISPAAVVTMELDERITAWNPAAQRLFGFSPEEAIGQQIDDLILRSSELRTEGHALHEEAAREGRASRIARRLHRDGAAVDVEVTMVPLVVEGTMTGFYAIYHDITELVAAREAADAANQAKSTFLAAMSHEIRTPMNAIIGMSGLLMDTPLGEEQRDYADTIRTSGDALLTIINDILDFSKIEAGKVELAAEPMPLAEVIERALDVAAPLAAAKGLELAYNPDADLPVWIVGDAGRLRQIVLNLLSNAVKFTESGEVVVTVGAEGPDPGERWTIGIDVRDTGLGITAEQLSRLFQSFSQADASISRRYGGTGLGLAISRRLAEAMDGSITAESPGIPGQGSTFHLVIRAPAATAPAEPGRTIEAMDLRGKSVLVVDDNATNRRILVVQLTRWGIVSAAAESPDQALAWVREGRRFDLGILDQVMPGMDGLALAAEIRATTSDRTFPLILCSSVGTVDRASRVIDGFLTKPVKPSALRDAVITALGGEAAVPALQNRPRIDQPGILAERHPLRILLAEDNAVNQKLALRLLERMGYSADVAGNGLEAVAALQRATYDVVLMDVQMPELDGLGATRRIRELWPADGPRIIAMTANALEGDREACLAAGMDDYISKPIRVPELVAGLERVTRARGAG